MVSATHLIKVKFWYYVTEKKKPTKEAVRKAVISKLEQLYGDSLENVTDIEVEEA